MLDLLLLFCQQEMSMRELIEPVQDKIEDLLETEYGLLTKLLEIAIITTEHNAAVEVI